MCLVHCLSIRRPGAAVPASSVIPFIPVGDFVHSRAAEPLCSPGCHQYALRDGGVGDIILRIPQY